MRGHSEDFLRIKDGDTVSFFVVSEPQKYTAHYIQPYVGGPFTKKNCHLVACPFCEMGHRAIVGMYVIVLDDHGMLLFLDVSKTMFRAMSEEAKSHCKKLGEDFDGMGEFLDSHLVKLRRLPVPERKSSYTGYEVEYQDIDSGSMASIKGQLFDPKAKIGRRYQKLLADMEDLIRPGTVEEDRKVEYA